MNIDDLPLCSVTELKGMFGPATRTALIEEMNRAVSARGAEARVVQGSDRTLAIRDCDEDEANIHEKPHNDKIA